MIVITREVCDRRNRNCSVDGCEGIIAVLVPFIGEFYHPGAPLSKPTFPIPLLQYAPARRFLRRP